MKHVWQILVILALTLQGMIPLGFMPGDAFAATPMVICSGMGEKTVTLDEHGQPVGEHSAKPKCAYSVLPVADGPVAAQDAGINLLPRTTVSVAVIAQISAMPVIGYRPPATAPPALT